MTDNEHREAMREQLEKMLSKARQDVEALEAMLANWDEPKWAEWCGAA